MTSLTRLAEPTRREVLALAGAGAASSLMAPFAWAAGENGLHGLSIFGNLAYPPDFSHFAYVNPAAPKGGRMNFQPPNWILNQSTQTFNTLNSFVLKGDAPPRMQFTFDSLMVRAYDEPDAMYGLVAASVDVSDDANVYTFHLRPEARFHDGSPLTAHDVAFSLTTLKEKGHPQVSQLLNEMVSAEALDDATLAVTLSGNQSRHTILTVADLPVLSAAYYSGRAFDSSTLDPPLGSGAYEVGRVNAGRFIEYERVKDYWAADLGPMRGHNNFDAIRIDFYTERQAGFEAFKKGEATYRQEFTSLTWAEGYDFPAVADGRVKLSEDFASEARPLSQGWYFNTRREKFADPRTRQAIALAFDFEWTNRNLFFSSYTRQASYFQKSDLVADGPPGPNELALLEPYRDRLPEEVFADAYVPPQSDGSGTDRILLRRAQDLLNEAGWEFRSARESKRPWSIGSLFVSVWDFLARLVGQTDDIPDFVVNDAGEPLSVEFLIRAAVFERILGPFVENLKKIGVEATIRQVDPTQFSARVDEFDFDIVGYASSTGPTPLDNLRLSFGTAAAGRSGSPNLAGISHPAIDGLLDQIRDVETREAFVTIARAVDRVARALHYWIPNWYLANHRVAHWDVFGWPTSKPDYAFEPERTWWFDSVRARTIGYDG